MYQTIVVGTDGSETAGVALHHAIELARVCGATLHIVNAYRPVTAAHVANAATVGAPTLDLESVNLGMQHESAEICERAAAQAGRSDVKCETHAVPGDPADALIDLAEQIHADLLVIGSRGMTGMRRFVLGSVPNKVSHHAPCSVLIVDTKGE
ncbi:MAG TPA: universal stress protein [Acidimicrobiia bacterium]|nr:universal stress protein [Acidimicrobiia bacterium]